MTDVSPLQEPVESPVTAKPDYASVHAKLKPWPWHPLQAVCIAFGAFIASQLLAFGLVSAGSSLYASSAGWSAERLAGWLGGATSAQFLSIVLAEVILVLIIYWLFRRQHVDGVNFRSLGFSRPTAKDFGLPVIAFGCYFAAFLAVVIVLQQFVPGLDINQEQDIGFKDAAGFGSLLMVFLALVVCAPIAEEVLFRGFLFGSFRRRTSFIIATLGTSLMFGAAHLLGGQQGAALIWIAGIDTMLLSFALCYLRETTGRLWAPIILHAMKNSLAFILLFVIKA